MPLFFTLHLLTYLSLSHRQIFQRNQTSPVSALHHLVHSLCLSQCFWVSISLNSKTSSCYFLFFFFFKAPPLIDSWERVCGKQILEMFKVWKWLYYNCWKSFCLRMLNCSVVFWFPPEKFTAILAPSSPLSTMFPIPPYPHHPLWETLESSLYSLLSKISQ